jgi:hypothetical protein
VTGFISPPSEPEGEPQSTHWEQVGLRLRRVLRYFLEHYTLVFSLLYGYVTVLGLIYATFLYRKFEINIFDYAEISDFLLAALRNPVALYGGALVVATIGFDIILSGPRRTWIRTLASILNILFAILIIGYAVDETAYSLKAGFEPKVEVRYRSYSGTADPVTEPGLEIIGATQKVVFFYDVNDKDNEEDNHTLVIPQTQIVSIEVPD